MTFHKLGIPYYYDTHNDWQYEYRLAPSNIWDSARAFDRGMYRAGALQCLSFGHSKRLEIGHGGAILTSKQHEYTALKQMAYDGRDLTISPWQDQVNFSVGYHYNMRLEDAARGMWLMGNGTLKSKESQLVEYPDCSKLNIDHLPK
jgi:dTDP-4-amino-4,6-dideoxygalactose transaminase